MYPVEVLTLFPDSVAGYLGASILGKAQEKGLLGVTVTHIRDYAEGKHRVTDDVPYGGGAGMVMKPEPLVAAIEAARAREPGARVILMSP
ncbi:MAG: tRNA (guanosine(37)-N1)-methyltransferase TrmD, partial [Archangium sp.]